LAGEELAVALHEPLEVVLLTALALLDHLVQLGEHVAEAGEVLGRHRTEALGHAAEIRPHHLLADVLHQLVEGRLRLGVDEPVVAQLPDAAGDVGRQRVEERLAHPGVVLGLERQRRSFAIDDVVEAFAEFLERAREVEVRLLACAAFAEPGAERVQALEASLHPAAHQPRERSLDPQTRQRVVGQLLEQLAGGQLGAERILRVVPARVAGLHPTSLRRAGRNDAPSRCPGRW
jgi:hypothetical protein